MKKRVKNKWLEALRSGEYKQCKNRLTNGRGFCCLGVLTDLYIKSPTGKKNGAYWKKDYEQGEPYFVSKSQTEPNITPEEVRHWAGLTDTVPEVNTPKGIASLAALNDANHDTEYQKPWSFNKIADTIEEQL